MPQFHYIRSYPSFPSVIPVHTASSLRVTHPSAMIPSPRRESSHRLACVKHSVSVHPEPGSNSSFNLFIYFHYLIFIFFLAFASSSIFIVLFVGSFSVDKIYTIKYFLFCQWFFFIFFVFFLINTLFQAQLSAETFYLKCFQRIHFFWFFDENPVFFFYFSLCGFIFLIV